MVHGGGTGGASCLFTSLCWCGWKSIPPWDGVDGTIGVMPLLKVTCGISSMNIGSCLMPMTRVPIFPIGCVACLASQLSWRSCRAILAKSIFRNSCFWKGHFFLSFFFLFLPKNIEDLVRSFGCVVARDYILIRSGKASGSLGRCPN